MPSTLRKRKKQKQQELLKEAVIKQIDDGDCPDQYKEMFKRAIEYL